MREIKFRAWDKEKKKMLYDGFCLVPTEPDWGAFNYSCAMTEAIADMYAEKARGNVAGVVVAQSGDYSVFDWADYYGLTNYVLMQYTGLKANGVEIYEGDIVHIWCTFFKVDMPLAAVYWNTKTARFDLKVPGGLYKNYFPVLHQCHWKCEILGNIHENPELLEVKK